MVATAVTTKFVFDLQPGDVYWCTADCGWVTGHSYLTYGPLLCGAQSVMYEGVPNYPTPARCWQIVEKYKVGSLSRRCLHCCAGYAFCEWSLCVKQQASQCWFSRGQCK